jgi:hypothetical protein
VKAQVSVADRNCVQVRVSGDAVEVGDTKTPDSFEVGAADWRALSVYAAKHGR